MRQVFEQTKVLVVLVALMLIPGLVFAATLEEKVESLEKKVEELSKEKGSMTTFKNDKVMVNLYGQINMAVLGVDDGNQRETYIVDNDHSSSRFGLNAKTTALQGATLGGRAEFEYQNNPSNKVNQSNKSISGELDERWLEAYVAFDNFGKLSLGQGDTASNNASEVDLSGTSVVGYSDIAAFAGGTLFYDKTAKAYTSTSIGSVLDNLDGLSRKMRVRYDTPKLFGFTLSGSAVSNSGHDLALRYDLNQPAFDLQAAIAWSENDKKQKVFNGSASLLLDFGLNFTVAGGQKDFNSTARKDDGEFLYGKIGYIFSAFSIGKTACSIDYGEYKNMAADSEKAKGSGLQLVQNVSAWNSEFYLGLRNHELDRTGTEDIQAVMSGLRVKF